MTLPPVPWAVPAVRAWLLADARVTALVDQRVSSRSPADVGALHVVLQTSTGDARPGSRSSRPALLAEARAARPAAHDGDPEAEVMAAAGLLAATLAAARNVTGDGLAWSVLRVSAPFPLPVDDTRGLPVFRGAVQAELHVRSAPT